MEEKVGRNDPCPCGSGKKYKQCCYGKEAKKAYTAAGKRKFSAKVISVGEKGTSIFQSIGGSGAPRVIEPFDGLRFRMTKKDYRAQGKGEVFPFFIPTAQETIFIQPTVTERMVLPEIYEMTVIDYRVKTA